MEKFLHPVELKNVSYERNKIRFQKKLKSFTFLTATLMLMFFSFTVSAKSRSINNSNEDGWVLDTIVNKVAFYHKIVLCGDYNVVLLKFDNQNQNNVSISWKENFKTKLMSNVDGFYGSKTLNLKTGLTSLSDCSDESNKLLKITFNDVDPAFVAEILDFNFIDITFK